MNVVTAIEQVSFYNIIYFLNGLYVCT